MARSSTMVLRSVYLPETLDRELRAIAFRSERSKNDLIRDMVIKGLKLSIEDGTLPFEAKILEQKAERLKAKGQVGHRNSSGGVLKSKKPRARSLVRASKTAAAEG